MKKPEEKTEKIDKVDKAAKPKEEARPWWLPPPFHSEPVKFTDFAAKVEELSKENPYGADKFYFILQDITDQTTRDNEKRLLFPKVPEKNRYVNVTVYGDNRCLLPCSDPKAVDGDYINASPISTKLAGNAQPYIATQAPTEFTKKDFWRLVWHQDTQIIVMLTREVEHNVIKCDKYWPEDEKVPLQGDEGMTVTLLSSQATPSIITRKFRLTHGKDEPRDVTHFQLLGWDDHCSPDEIESVHTLITEYRKIRDPKHPVIVHCSAGIGRSGTFICLDALIDHIKHLQAHPDLPQAIDIAGLVFELRKQRTGMVQSKVQLKFIYHFINTAFKKGWLDIKPLAADEKKKE